MTLFADIILAFIAIVAPKDGATVPTLTGAQKAYLAAGQKARFAALGKAKLRKRLAETSGVQQPLRLAWEGPTNTVFDLTIERVGGEKQNFSIPYKTEAYITNLEIGEKYVWRVAEAGDEEEAKPVSATFTTEAVGPRLLLAGGVMNFRDLGGWKTASGRRVRQNMIFRSAGLRSSTSRKGGGLFGGTVSPGVQRITADGISTLLGDFKIKTDVDLRTNQEMMGVDSSVLGVTWVRESFAAYDFIDNSVRGREPFAKLFKIFADKKNYPILVHCSGGRDRTGTLAFLLNGILGVSGDDLCRDWEATAFIEDDLKFSPDRLERLLKYLESLGGRTVAEQCELYAISCGVTKEQIAKFREVMLEGGH